MSASYDSTASEHGKGNRGATRSFGEQSSRVAEEVQELGRVALANAGEAAATLKEKGQEAAATLKEKGQHALEAGRDKAKTAKSKFDDVVAEHPMKSVLIAVGVGVVLGYALNRRRD